MSGWGFEGDVTEPLPDSPKTITCAGKTNAGTRCRNLVKPPSRFCWQHSRGFRKKWRALTRNQSVAFVFGLVGVLGVLLTLLTWRYSDFWAKPHASDPPPSSRIPKDIAEQLARLKSSPLPIPAPRIAVAKPSKTREQPVLPLKERTLQLETRLAFFGVTRRRMLKELPFAEIPPSGYRPEDVPGNREIEAKSLQLFQKDFLPECISIMSEFRSRGFDVTKLRRQMTDVAGEGTDFEWIAGELKLLADQLDTPDQKSA
jgi:hypothetical protein